MKRRPFGVCLLVAGLGLFLALAAIARAERPAPAVRPAAASRTVRLNLDEDPPTLDPALAYEGPSATVVEQLFVGLVDLDDATAEVQPDLATGWSVSPGGDVLSFTLRADVTWSDGTRVTAGDVRYGILRSLELAGESEYARLLFVIRNAEAYSEGALADPDQVGVAAVDDTHLRIVLEEPAAHVLSILALPVARPVPRAAVEAWGDAWTEPGHIVTSGPYLLAEWVPGDHILLDKNPAYPGTVQGLPELSGAPSAAPDHVYFSMVDPATAWQMFLDGQLDSAEVPPGVTPDSSLADKVHVQPGGVVEFYGFSASQPPFDKPLVRRAFAAATDRAALAQAATDRDPEAALTLTPPGVFGHVDGDAGIDYDPAQAQQWLADAGYPGGAGLPEITLWVPPFASHRAVAEAVREGWHATLGVSVTLAAEPPVPELNTGHYQIWRYGWAMEYPDAYNFLGDGLGMVRGAFGGWDSTTVEALLGMAAAESDPGTRQWLYRQTEKALVENDAVVLPLYYHAARVATRPHLERTYPAGGYFDIATWRLAWKVFLPVVSVGTD